MGTSAPRRIAFQAHAHGGDLPRQHRGNGARFPPHLLAARRRSARSIHRAPHARRHFTSLACSPPPIDGPNQTGALCPPYPTLPDRHRPPLPFAHLGGCVQGPRGVAAHAKRASKAAPEPADGDAGDAEAAPKRRGRKPKATILAAGASEDPSKRRRGRQSKAAIEAEAAAAEAAAAAAAQGRVMEPITYTSDSGGAAAHDDAGVDSILEQAAMRGRADSGAAAEGEAALAAAPPGDKGDLGVPISSIISDEARQVLAEIEPQPWKITLPPQHVPRTPMEVPHAEALISQAYWDRRLKEAKDIEERAWQSHHHQNRHAVNRYAMVRRVARIMAEVENYDFLREEKAPQHIPPWARAEVIFEREFDEFNAYVAANIDEMVKGSGRAAADEELDILDDALFLLANDDDKGNVLNQKVAQQTEDHLLVDEYLDGILPGVSLSSLSEAYADDIFAGGDDDDVSVGAGAAAGAEDGPEGATPDAPKRRGRKSAAAAAE
mmetsp:Transcript_32548/g.97117  ORF Transcript_32548/g.97117 Transcript_32548/m.97117 type:complete len:493 (-) Transcript_32548:448-1926(-)